MMQRSPDDLRRDIFESATRLHAALRATGHQLVLAESCTGGLIAASLAQLGGISEVFCGSMVTYQTPIKTEWLGIPSTFIESHNVVSQEVADAMALSVLSKTPAATLSASITGHLGPSDDPREGHAYIAIARQGQLVSSVHHQFGRYESNQRLSRQLEGVYEVIQQLLTHTSS